MFQQLRGLDAQRLGVRRRPGGQLGRRDVLALADEVRDGVALGDALVDSTLPSRAHDVADLVSHERPTVDVERRLVEVSRNGAGAVHDEGVDAANRARARAPE